ncbi:MAG: D-alanyl-lipoteichoic acid biosynthesis protein DltD [Patescibacteria group bacterium]
MNKKATINYLIFLLILITLLILANYFYTAYVLTDTLLSRNEEQIEDNFRNTKILFSGGSHVMTGLSPDRIENSFNFSSLGENYAYTYYKLKYILESYDIRLNTLILPIDLQDFSSSRIKLIENEWHTNVWYWHKYINYENLKLIIKETSYLQWQTAKFFPVIGNGPSIIMKLRGSLINTDMKLGQQIRVNDFSKSDDQDKSAKFRAEWHLSNSETFDATMSDYFERILNLGKEYNLNILIVRFPVSEEYYKFSAEYLDIDEYYEKVYEITDKYDNIRILDYHDLFFDKDYFFNDPDHLNKNGADYLTDLIKKEIDM